MLRMICEDLSFVLVKNRIVSEEDRDNYIYGLELLLTTLLAIGSIAILGILLNKILITGVFLIVFCSLRSYSGGYHANQYWKCYSIGCLTYLCLIALVERVSAVSNSLLNLLVLIISYIGIFVIAPLNSEKNPKTEADMKKNSIMVKVFVSGYTLIAIIGMFVCPSASELWFTIAFTQLIVTIFLMVTILQRRVLR